MTYPHPKETVLFKQKPSPIEGVGLFALQDIPKGTKLYVSEQMPMEWHTKEEFDELSETQQTFILERFPVVEDTGWIHPHADYMLSFVNHSDEGNYSPIFDCSIKDIKQGEELTFNYEKCKPV